MSYLRKPAIGFVHAAAGSQVSPASLNSVVFDQVAGTGAVYDSTNKQTMFSTPILGITRICANEAQGSSLLLAQYCASTNETDTQDRKYVFSGRTCDQNDTQYTKGDSESYCRNETVKMTQIATPVTRAFSWLNWTHLEYYRVTS